MLVAFRDLDKEPNHCWAITINKFVQLQLIWSNSQILLRTNMVFYKACILSTLLYRCKSWAFTHAQVGKFNAIDMGILHKLSGVKSWQKLRIVKVATRCDIKQIPTMFTKTRMQWVGHMVRMRNIRFPKKKKLGIGEGRGERVGEAQVGGGHTI